MLRRLALHARHWWAAAGGRRQEAAADRSQTELLLQTGAGTGTAGTFRAAPGLTSPCLLSSEASYSNTVEITYSGGATYRGTVTAFSRKEGHRVKWDADDTKSYVPDLTMGEVVFLQ